MIAKIISCQNAQKAIDYIQDIYKKNKKATLLMHSKGVLLTDNKSLASLMESYADKGGNRPKEPFLHIPISFHPNDAHRITDAFARQVISDYMKQMGYSNCDYVVYRHYDKKHPHFHLFLCTVDKDGNKINRSNERLHNRDVCKGITKKYGLYMSNGKENVNRDRLHQKDAAKYSMFDIISSAKEKCQDWKEFNDMLKDNGISMKFHYNNATGKLMGIAFSNGEYSFSGRQIDRSLTLPMLREKFGDFREIVHESIHLCYERYQRELARLNSGNTYGGQFFTMLRMFPYWDSIFPEGLPKTFKTPYPSVPDLLSHPKNSCLEHDIVHTKDGKTDYVGLSTLLAILLEPYEPQMALAGAGGGSSGGGMPWRDLDDDDRWKFRFVVDPSVFPRYIKPRYIKSKPIVSRTGGRRK